MESALHFLAPELLDVQVSGVDARRAGNHDPDRAPHDAYPCAGDDEWCAIAVETDAQWRALRAALGEPAWAMDPALDTLPGRQAAPRTLIDRELAAFTAQHEPRALMGCCRRPASPPAWCSDRATTWRTRSSPTARSSAASSTPRWARCRTRATSSDRRLRQRPRFPAPCLGEHTFEVLTEVLGLDDDEVARCSPAAPAAERPREAAAGPCG